MIALDTNVLVRYLVQDDHQQSQQARELLETLNAERVGFISREVVLELAWVLSGAYGFPRDEVGRTLEELVGSEELRVEAAADVVRAANSMRKTSAEFSDLMILAASARCGAEAVYTFDRKFARLPGVEAL